MATPLTPPTVTPTSNLPMIIDIFAWSGTAMVLALMLTPSVLFLKIFKNKKENGEYDYAQIPELMLIFNAGCGILWFSYWFRVLNLIPMYSALTNSCVTAVFTLLYLYCYSQGNCIKWLLYSFIALDLMAQMAYVFIYLIKNAEIVGTIAMIVNILMFAAPGQNILTVMNTGDYNLIPIVSTFVGLLTSICWFFFGILSNLVNCYVPNGIGIFLSLVQIIIYYYYYCNRKEDKKEHMLDNKEKTIN